MSRCGYVDDGDFDNWSHIRWRGQVTSAIKGKRGQAFLRELIDALDAMPEKRLIPNDLQNEGGVCAIGSVGARRGVDMSQLDPEDPETIANAFGIASQLVREIEYENDEYWDWEGQKPATPEARWQHMRDWALCYLREPVPTEQGQ